MPDLMELLSKYSELALQIFGLVTLIVKLTPTLKDDNFILPLIKILGKLTNKQLK